MTYSCFNDSIITLIYFNTYLWIQNDKNCFFWSVVEFQPEHPIMAPKMKIMLFSCVWTFYFRSDHWLIFLFYYIVYCFEGVPPYNMLSNCIRLYSMPPSVRISQYLFRPFRFTRRCEVHKFQFSYKFHIDSKSSSCRVPFSKNTFRNNFFLCKVVHCVHLHGITNFSLRENIVFLSSMAQICVWVWNLAFFEKKWKNKDVGRI